MERSAYSTNQTPLTHFGWENVLSSTSAKGGKKLSNERKKGTTQHRIANIHFAKFECKGMKTVGSYRLHKPDTS